MALVEQVCRQSWRVRYPDEDGHVGRLGGFRSAQAARAAGRDRAAPRCVDPAAARITVADWVERWWPTVSVAERTAENYQRIRSHVLPRCGAARLCLRHSHKTWLIADGAPEIEQRPLAGLERRWHQAVAVLSRALPAGDWTA